MADELINEQAKIAVYDPKVSGRKVLADLDYLDTRTTEKNANSITSFDSAYEACAGAHAIAVLTEWDEFVGFDWRKIYDSMQKPAFIFDGRNLLNATELKAIGFVYQAIGS
ncbi:UDP-glucose 6-dehydrogenase TuaD [compost metagenome]